MLAHADVVELRSAVEERIWGEDADCAAWWLSDFFRLAAVRYEEAQLVYKRLKGLKAMNEGMSYERVPDLSAAKGRCPAGDAEGSRVAVEVDRPQGVKK